jgi:hypothetical protein
MGNQISDIVQRNGFISLEHFINLDNNLRNAMQPSKLFVFNHELKEFSARYSSAHLFVSDAFCVKQHSMQVQQFVSQIAQKLMLMDSL